MGAQFTIVVSVDEAPATCTIAIGSDPAIRGPTGWTDGQRSRADFIAARVLGLMSGTTLQALESSDTRMYRCPERQALSDGWKVVPLTTHR